MSRTQELRPGAHRRQSGFGLIEVLVAVVVLSIGLLGLASLQMHTLRNNESSLERGMAVVETHSVIEAMRADRTGAMNGAFNIELDANPPTDTTFAKSTIAVWRANLVAVLGTGAAGAVACDGTDCTITVRWDDSRATNGLEQFTLETQVQL